MAKEKVGVIVGTTKLEYFYFRVDYSSYKDLICKVYLEKARRYRGSALIGIFLEDGTYIQVSKYKYIHVDSHGMIDEIAT